MEPFPTDKAMAKSGRTQDAESTDAESACVAERNPVVPCPNEGCGKKFRMSDAIDHFFTCQWIRTVGSPLVGGGKLSHGLVCAMNRCGRGNLLEVSACFAL